jgi:osmoprotectant transport system permease protein
MSVAEGTSMLGAVLAWLLDPSHWRGSDGIPARVGEHLLLSGLTTLVAAAIALPTGVGLGHAGRGGFVAMGVGNVGRALPSLALLALALPPSFALGLGLGFWPTFFALVPLGIPPIMTNSYVAIREVDRDVLEAARGIGMGEWRLLREVELPLAAPLGALVAGGGLGRYIVDGLARQDYPLLVVGALLVALLAVAVELGFGLFERLANRTVLPDERSGPILASSPRPHHPTRSEQGSAH